MTTTTEEDAWEGRLKCNTCGDYQRDHKLGRDYCLKKGCDCLGFARPGPPTILDNEDKR